MLLSSIRFTIVYALHILRSAWKRARGGRGGGRGRKYIFTHEEVAGWIDIRCDAMWDRPVGWLVGHKSTNRAIENLGRHVVYRYSALYISGGAFPIVRGRALVKRGGAAQRVFFAEIPIRMRIDMRIRYGNAIGEIGAGGTLEGAYHFFLAAGCGRYAAGPRYKG